MNYFYYGPISFPFSHFRQYKATLCLIILQQTTKLCKAGRQGRTKTASEKIKSADSTAANKKFHRDSPLAFYTILYERYVIFPHPDSLDDCRGAATAGL